MVTTDANDVALDLLGLRRETSIAGITLRPRLAGSFALATLVHHDGGTEPWLHEPYLVERVDLSVQNMAPTALQQEAMWTSLPDSPVGAAVDDLVTGNDPLKHGANDGVALTRPRP